ncbi:hypothetical protein BC826DRAFT_78133 [Russula brevipes]|nr:hypothetical protein BC826DRAFT_78133 [Russula brevipes]
MRGRGLDPISTAHPMVAPLLLCHATPYKGELLNKDIPACTMWTVKLYQYGVVCEGRQVALIGIVCLEQQCYSVTYLVKDFTQGRICSRRCLNIHIMAAEASRQGTPFSESILPSCSIASRTVWSTFAIPTWSHMIPGWWRTSGTPWPVSLCESCITNIAHS